jgi:predicted transcriptional regulator
MKKFVVGTTVFLSKELDKKIKAAAVQENLTKSKIIRAALEKYVEGIVIPEEVPAGPSESLEAIVDAAKEVPAAE